MVYGRALFSKAMAEVGWKAAPERVIVPYEIAEEKLGTVPE